MEATKDFQHHPEELLDGSFDLFAGLNLKPMTEEQLAEEIRKGQLDFK